MELKTAGVVSRVVRVAHVSPRCRAENMKKERRGDAATRRRGDGGTVFCLRVAPSPRRRVAVVSCLAQVSSFGGIIRIRFKGSPSQDSQPRATRSSPETLHAR